MTAFQENMSSMFKEPRRKGHLKQKPCSPLPVLVESETGIPAHLAVWKSFSGRFNGDCVEVCDPEDIVALYNKVLNLFGLCSSVSFWGGSIF